MPKQEYDAQGKLFHHYAKLAGWEQKRIDALLLSKFKATHFNALNQVERRQAINIMKGYVKKAEKQKAARLRQMIMAYVSARGQDIDWLHDCMGAWGYGDSLRKLTYQQTIEIWDAVREALRPVEEKNNG
jgi:hypothetical protein